MHLVLSCVFPGTGKDSAPRMLASVWSNRDNLPVTQVAQGSDVRVGCLGFAGARVASQSCTFALCHADATTTAKVRWNSHLCQGRLTWLLAGPWPPAVEQKGPTGAVNHQTALPRGCLRGLPEHSPGDSVAWRCPLALSIHEDMWWVMCPKCCTHAVWAVFF